MTLQSDNIYLSDGPEVAEGIKEDCSEKRDLAIYDAAVALERSDHVPESKRPELIFETIEALEKASLVPPGLPEKYEESE